MYDWVKKQQKDVVEREKRSCFSSSASPSCLFRKAAILLRSLHVHIDILDIISQARESSWWAPRDILNDSALCWRERVNNRGYQHCLVTNTHLHLWKRKKEQVWLRGWEDRMWLFKYKGGAYWWSGDMSQYQKWRGGHCPLTSVLSVHPGRYVRSPFTISNPVWKPILNVRLLPKLARVLSDWLKYCNPALSDRAWISAKSIR